jgi:hypothetical protein
MRSRAEICAGVCGFATTVVADAPDEQMVALTITTNCDTIARLAEALMGQQIDAYQEISKGFNGAVLSAARAHLSGCCAGCAVPPGIFKSVQAAARVALPRSVSIELTSEP